MIVYQRPNRYAIVMLLSLIALFLLRGILAVLVETAFVLSGTIWSYLELTSGANRLRNVFGGFGLAVVVIILISTLYYA